MQVLIVDPHPIWAQRIQSWLRSAGATVVVAGDLSSAVASLDEAWPGK